MLAVERKDDLRASLLQWMFCWLMLQTGGRPGHVFTASDFLAHVKTAKKTKARLDSWGEFRCESGGWSPVQDVPLALNNHYWGSLGVAARFKDAIKRDPAFAIAQFPTLTEQQIEKELVHVRQGASADKLQVKAATSSTP
ncbi:hypothetical protein COCSUDRAFT_38860 [Coccomyxa subellipsoidea C-169]|uniref:Uncharacterized protein n=1 Tax=Coccomyxa subellipsoidea (strain C-169) TaxID=574566 RepID=I0Z8Y6_COCSC|nr:hypothetical protein COCSUDRAFT_38860 [Coccomyxa subellipsoidea C-169]EIE27105.1 hypothetical protein COCSUDRAFT_38860 [Coccomyxa subellipsoidea C-169]|eukprot:XP_005651649.1 hypothetical protein COCSUDRAFT_38860 [Coccomyxa subellipsoidea C-169]